ncbi:MAG: glucoamylase family protein [Bacteroidota bacterium]|nr:glucoamylase family protein [Bacteroidota bacterium]
MKIISLYSLFIFSAVVGSCHKESANNPEPPPPSSFAFNSLKIDGVFKGFTYFNVSKQPVIKLNFQAKLSQTSIASSVSIRDNAGVSVPYITSFENQDSTLIIKPSISLNFITKYVVDVSTALQSVGGGALQSAISVTLTTAIDSTDKFTRVTDDALLTLIQKQTFKYFWDFGHPTSGMARERNTSGDVVTTGGTGFGIMSMLVGIERGFIARADGLSRISTITSFLKNNCTRYHGAFSHWINGSSGATIPFGTKDDGADVVETAYLMEGLLCARQYFNRTDATETNLRTDINTLWNAVEWNWFRQNNQNVLYWHWSPVYNWDMNMPIHGWDEALITYVLAASSPNYSIPKVVYDNGWANNGAIKNGNTYYGYTLPLGPPNGGPLFFEHYSFVCINPNHLTDAYADYQTQTINHSKINYSYCVDNPLTYNGYSSECWGLTASDDNISGYSAHAPGNDLGIISPTAAISSLPYTPTESMNALRFFYYKLGDKIWGNYGFTDAFNLTNIWFANSYLAIDQGPEIVMIENYRTGLLWNLFMSCPEVKTGMKNLGFQSSNL